MRRFSDRRRLFDWRRAPGSKPATATTCAPLFAGRGNGAGKHMVMLAVLASVTLAPPVLAQDVGLPIGTTPAAAEVEDLDGNAIQLNSLIGGRPVLIEFWATWCPLCKALEPHLQEAKRTWGDKADFIVVAVGVNQTPRSIRRYIADHDVVGPVYFDRRGAAVRAYMTPTTSYVVILGATGKVAYTGTGERQPISEALAKITGN